MLLTEVRSKCWEDTLLPHHTVAFAPASSEGRAGEGIVVAVKKSCQYHVLDWNSDPNVGLWMKLQFRGDAMALLLASIYIPPGGSAQLQTLDASQRFDSLAAQALAACAEGYVLIAGDFNARIGNRAGCHVDGTGARGFTDAVVNAHGRRLLDLSNVTGLCFCTSRVAGDLQGDPTFRVRRNTQASRPDHVLVSQNLLPLVALSRVNRGRKNLITFQLRWL